RRSVLCGIQPHGSQSGWSCTAPSREKVSPRWPFFAVSISFASTNRILVAVSLAKRCFISSNPREDLLKTCVNRNFRLPVQNFGGFPVIGEIDGQIGFANRILGRK